MNFHIKYRPKSFDSVIGQDSVVDSLSAQLESDPAHAYLFCGPSGVGKTTLARILAREVGCSDVGLLEIDAATTNNVAAIRQIMNSLLYKSFGEYSSKMVILDECHSLSYQSWQALLKIVEEPPPHAFFSFCTTFPDKVPKTIKTRCSTYHLRALSIDDLEDLLEYVCGQEKIKIDIPGFSFRDIAQASEGSARQALVFLAMSLGLESFEDVEELLRTPTKRTEAIDLARLLASPKRDSWPTAVNLLKGLRDTDPEGIRMVISSYMVSCILGNSSNEKKVNWYVDVLDRFSKSFAGMDQVILATADLLIERDDQ